MTIAMTLAPGGDAELVEASVAFHLHAGVDHVTVIADELMGGLDRFVATGRLAVRESMALPPTPPTRHADWEIEAAPGEFWWPRGGSLDEVLASVPQHYDAVLALERTLLRTAGEPFFEHAALRLAPTSPVHDTAWKPARRLVRRSSVARPSSNEPDLCVLRLWYPIEVLCVRSATDDAAPRHQAALAAGALVEDTRLRDALRALRDAEGRGWRVPSNDGQRLLEFPPISPVDDALFALEAAAAGDVDVLEARELLDALSGRLNSVERMILVRIEARLRAARRSVRRRLRKGAAAS